MKLEHTEAKLWEKMGALAEDDNVGDVDVNKSARSDQDTAAAAPLPILPCVEQQMEQNSAEPCV